MRHKLRGHCRKPEISKQTYQNQCADKNDRSVATHKTGLEITPEPAELNDHFANRMKESVENADIKHFPETFARDCLDGVDQRCVVNLVDVVLVLEQSWHFQQRASLKDVPAGSDAEQSEQDRESGQHAFCRDLCVLSRSGLRHR